MPQLNHTIWYHLPLKSIRLELTSGGLQAWPALAAQAKRLLNLYITLNYLQGCVSHNLPVALLQHPTTLAMKRLFLTFPHSHLSTVFSHSNPTHLQDEPGSSFSASNAAPSCQVKGGRVTFLPPHSIPKTTGLAALAQPSLTPSGNYTQGFSHLYTKSYKLLCISPSYDTPNQVLQQLMLFRISRFSLWHCSNGTFNLESQHKFRQHKPFVALLSSMFNFLLH